MKNAIVIENFTPKLLANKSKEDIIPSAFKEHIFGERFNLMIPVEDIMEFCNNKEL